LAQAGVAHLLKPTAPKYDSARCGRRLCAMTLALDGPMDSNSQTWTDSLALIDSDNPEWSTFRNKMARFVNSRFTESTVGVILVVNVVLVIYESDLIANGQIRPHWMVMTLRSFLCVYILEILCSIFVHRREFFTQVSRLFDISIVFFDLIQELLLNSLIPPVSWLRVFRMLRLVRVVKAVRALRELAFIMQGLSSAMRALLWSSILLFFVLSFWAIVAVEFIHPLVQRLEQEGAFDDCQHCARAYRSVMGANLTWCQTIIAGDSWGQYSLPVIEAHP